MRKGEPVLDDNGNPIPAFICSYRKPFSYYVLKNKDGHVIKTAFEDDKEELLKVKTSEQTIELLHYEGCPYWKAPESTGFNDFLD